MSKLDEKTLLKAMLDITVDGDLTDEEAGLHEAFFNAIMQMAMGHPTAVVLFVAATLHEYPIQVIGHLLQLGYILRMRVEEMERKAEEAKKMKVTYEN